MILKGRGRRRLIIIILILFFTIIISSRLVKRVLDEYSFLLV